jgi:hypothetical protein
MCTKFSVKQRLKALLNSSSSRQGSWNLAHLALLALGKDRKQRPYAFGLGWLLGASPPVSNQHQHTNVWHRKKVRSASREIDDLFPIAHEGGWNSLLHELLWMQGRMKMPVLMCYPCLQPPLLVCSRTSWFIQTSGGMKMPVLMCYPCLQPPLLVCSRTSWFIQTSGGSVSESMRYPGVPSLVQLSASLRQPYVSYLNHLKSSNTCQAVSTQFGTFCHRLFRQ